jgi:hypothetical protein
LQIEHLCQLCRACSPQVEAWPWGQQANVTHQVAAAVSAYKQLKAQERE